MREYLRIINIDGTDGSGKTTQIGLFAQYLKRKGISCLTNHLDDNIKSGKEICDRTMKFLQDNPDGVVINDGSIARMMVVDLVSGLTRSKIIKKYQDLMFLQEKLNHKFGTANFLIVMDNIEEANRRLIQRSRMLAAPVRKIEDFQKEKDIVSAMRRFDVNTMSKVIKFDVIEVSHKESMMDVFDRIKEYLLENFEIKKPLEKEPSD